MKRAFYLLAIAASLLTGACTHQVHPDYAQYLINNQGAVTFPRVAKSADYYLPPGTDDHNYKFSSAMGGLGNSWAVQFGRILDATMLGTDVRTAFGDVEKIESPKGGKGLVMIYAINSYVFEGFQAKVNLTITARKGSKKLLSKKYFAAGISQGGKMFWGGAYAMKNAVQQSTKSALDQILTEFIGDLKRVYRARSTPSDGDNIVLDRYGLPAPAPG